MIRAASRVVGRAADLRRDFDRSFAEPPPLELASSIDLLAICIGVQRFALRLSEIANLSVAKKITQVPGARGALLGLVGLRGSIMPVYDLHKLLGRPGSKTPRWLVIAAASPVAFAFEAFEGQFRASPDAITRERADTEANGAMQEFVRVGDVLRPIIRLLSVIEGIEA
jgi:purine-binding chemotaxis protein CheW